MRSLPMAPPAAAAAPVAHPFHVLAKPTGAICNLDCSYCFYLVKEELYPGSKFRMKEDVVRAYLRQAIESEPSDQVTIAWQGGEPTLLGAAFFRRAAELAAELLPAGKTIAWTIQTNGTKLDDEWAALFLEHDYLVGLSLDGPRELHDAYRVDKGGRGTFDRVQAAARLLQRHGVPFNVLTTVHAANGDHGLAVYRYLRDELGARHVQFIPIVEREGADGVSERSVGAAQWGRFLTEIFDEWVTRDVGEMFVLMFDWALASWLGLESPACIFRKRCGDALALEHTGDVYSCDHFVTPANLLGNVRDMSLAQMVGSQQQQRFGAAKETTLPQYCRSCAVRFACNGECPKNRFITTPDGEPGLNYLCAGYKQFFSHVDEPMRMMAQLLRQGREAADVSAILARREAAPYAGVGRNEPCPCGSGAKFKHCHG